MGFAKPLSFLLTFIFAGCLSAALAADKETLAGTSQQSQNVTSQIGLGQGDANALSPMTLVSKADAPFLVRRDRGQRIELSPFPDVCFTMRSYKVKRTERLRDDESGGMEFSTCQMGSNYQVRSVDNPPVKLK